MLEFALLTALVVDPSAATREPLPLITTIDPSRAEPSVSAVVPNRVFLERTLDVTIGSDETAWTDAVAVDFGPGITVDAIRVASPTGLVATITVDVRAEPGIRDVTVRDGDLELVYAGAFAVEAPLVMSKLEGTRASGSLLVGSAIQRDRAAPLDPSNLVLAFTDPGLQGQIQGVYLFGLDFLVSVDVPVTTGTHDLRVVSGPEGAQIASTAPEALDIVARTPLPLSVGDTVGAVAAPFDSVLYAFTPPAERKQIELSVTASDPNIVPTFILLPASGRFSELIAFDSQATTSTSAAEPLYVVYWDSSGVAPHEFTLHLEMRDPPPPEVEPNDKCEQATRIEAGSTMSGSLASATDVDWFVFTAGAADVGKVVHVLTQPGEPSTDTVLEVFASDCATSLGGSSPDFAPHEDHRSEPIPAAGDYYVKVSASPDGFVTPDYELAVAIE